MRELLKLCEQLYLERSVLQAVLRESGLVWEQKYRDAVENPRLRARVHCMFERAEVRLSYAERCEASLQALLAALATKQNPN